MNAEVIEKSGGVAFELILKQANRENQLTVLSNSPPKEKKISYEEIEKKLQEATERRQSYELTKLQNWLKEKERVAEANQRVLDFNDSFAKETRKKLDERMEAQREKFEAQRRALQERLTQHSQRVDEIRKMGEQCSVELKEKIEKKMETSTEKRQAQLAAIQEKLREHKRHVDEVIEANLNHTKDAKEKIVHKMETSLKNRERQLNRFIMRVREHNSKAEQLCRSRNVNQSQLDDSIGIGNFSTLTVED